MMQYDASYGALPFLACTRNDMTVRIYSETSPKFEKVAKFVSV